MRKEILPGIPYRPISYQHYHHIARDGDALLWGPRTFTGKIIAGGTGGPFCHATMAFWMEDRIWSAGYEEKRNGFAGMLWTEARMHPNCISVFRPQIMNMRPHDAVSAMLDSMGGIYQWKNIRFIIYSQLTVLRLMASVPVVGDWWRKQVNKQCAKSAGGICSSSYHRAIRKASQISICPHKPEALVTPNDLALNATFENPVMEYLGTIATMGD